ncbi:MAG: nucleotidyltransferase [Anaerolineales bacterium]|nr:DUF86 domain-containing protein [Anaerolineae bacterium]PWB76592.1 MAG: nucleotidyltransferase [Anaerolineales bacterium]
MRDDRQRLMDMLEAIEKIEQYVSSESASQILADDELLNVWVVHHLQIIGEAASKISPAFREAHPEVAWGGMIGMRHVLVHGYFETNTALVWKVIERDLPQLKAQLKKILEEE